MKKILTIEDINGGAYIISNSRPEKIPKGTFAGTVTYQKGVSMVKNMLVEDFIKEFGPCTAGEDFARRYMTMHDVYEALLDPAYISSEWAAWILDRLPAEVLPTHRFPICAWLAKQAEDQFKWPESRRVIDEMYREFVLREEIQEETPTPFETYIKRRDSERPSSFGPDNLVESMWTGVIGDVYGVVMDMDRKVGYKKFFADYLEFLRSLGNPFEKEIEK